MIRPDYVALLADVQIDATASPDTWRHNDGQPLDGADVQKVLGATIGELCAALGYADLIMRRKGDHLADIARAEALATPYVAQLGPGAGVAEVVAAMPAGGEREEFAQLAEKIAFLKDTETRGTP